ncbi:MAG: GGDEF domain-containing protein [Actinobacteria bacterium]|nr:GGDEF domain-containing protein [Actinomycetota bacterium]
MDTQERLLEQQSVLTAVVADAGRVEALVAQVGDTRTNPAHTQALREELRRTAELMDESARAVTVDAVQDDRPGTAAGERGRRLESLRAVILRFSHQAGLAAAPDADLAQGQLRRGSLDGLYPGLREQVDTARSTIHLGAQRERRAWHRTVVAGLVAVAAAGAGLGWLVLGPVRRRLAEQRRDAEQLAEVRQRELARTTAIARATSAVLRHDDARSTVCEAATQLIDGALGTLWEDDGHGDLICTAAVHADIFGMRLPLSGQSITSTVFHTARPRTCLAVAEDPDVDTDSLLSLSRACGQDLTAGVWVPVVVAGRCRAVLALGIAGPTDADTLAQQRPTLEILASEAAVALERQDLMRQLAADAESDPLTGAANRRAWDVVLPRAVYTSRATGAPVSMIMLDIDHFTIYNDAHGHPAGDTLLRRTVGAWRQVLRPGDTLARYGGEEFAVLLPGHDLDKATRTADALRQLLPAGQTCSAGVAQLAGAEDATALLTRADQALYRAKQDGRNRTVTAEQPQRRR